MSVVVKAGAFARTDSPSHLVIGRLIASALALISAPIVARAIGPEGRGETAAALALFNLVPIVLALGVPLEVRRLAAHGHASAAVRTARIFCLTALIPAAPVAILLDRLLFQGLDGSTRVVAVVGVILSPLMMSWMCDNAVLVAQRRYRAVFLLQVTPPSVYVILVLVLWIAGEARPSTVLACNIIATSATFVGAMLLTRIPVGGTRWGYRKLVGNGIRYAGSSIAEAASSRLDQVLVLPLIGAYQAGIYAVAATVSSIPLAFGQAIGASYYPLAAIAHEQDRPKLRTEAIRTGVAAGVLVVPIAGIASVVAIPLVFGSGFTASVPVAGVLFSGAAALVIAYIGSMVLAAEGRGVQMTIAQVISLAVGVLLLMVLGPLWGALGASVASSLSQLVLLAVSVFVLRVRIRDVLPRPIDFRLLVARMRRDH